MGQENGIEIGRQLRQIAPDMIIIVITGYLKYSVEGYKIQAARYLLKPVNAQLLYSELDEVLSLDDRQTLVLKERDMYHRIRRRDILYVETMGRGTRFHTLEGTFDSREALPLARRRVETVKAVWRSFQEKFA